jgi:hypothetical protein
MLVHACGSRCAREGTSSEAELARGRRGPSSEAEACSRECEPSSEADLVRRGREPLSEADPARGGALLGRSGGLRGPPRCGSYRVCMFCVRLEVCFAVFAGFKHDSSRFFRGPSLVIPDSNPRASAGVSVRFPQMLKPTDRTLSPWLQAPFRGAASADPRV